MLRAHEGQLKEAQAVPATLPELEATKASLKVRWPGCGLQGPGPRGALGMGGALGVGVPWLWAVGVPWAWGCPG